jgi:hypothetical protein
MLRRVEILVEGVRRVNGVEFLRGIFTGVLEDDLLTTGVLFSQSSASFIQGTKFLSPTWQEFRHIVGLSVDNDPA